MYKSYDRYLRTLHQDQHSVLIPNSKGRLCILVLKLKEINSFINTLYVCETKSYEQLELLLNQYWRLTSATMYPLIPSGNLAKNI